MATFHPRSNWGQSIKMLPATPSPFWPATREIWWGLADQDQYVKVLLLET